MKILIIEDEYLASEHLQNLLKKTDETIEIAGILDSVNSAINWFQNNQIPDLLFMDIQLGDGLSFSIFEQVEVTTPVIFTTAYNEYAIEAFKVNSIDYLLKPIKQEDIQHALLKFKATPWFKEKTFQNEKFAMDKMFKLFTNNYKKRFLIKTGVHIKSIAVEDILYFYSLEKSTFLTTDTGKNYLIDYTLEQLEELLDRKLFYRINRKYFLSVSAIEDIITDAKYRLRIKVRYCDDQEVLVSREKMSDFKEWLDQ